MSYNILDINGVEITNTTSYQSLFDTMQDNIVLNNSFRTTNADIADDVDALEAIGTIITDATVARTFAMTDIGKHINCTSATPVTITLPQDSDVAIPIGSEIVITQYGAGVVTFVAGTGATVNSANGNLSIASQYGGVTCKKMSANTWLIIGSLG